MPSLAALTKKYFISPPPAVNELALLKPLAKNADGAIVPENPAALDTEQKEVVPVVPKPIVVEKKEPASRLMAEERKAPSVMVPVVGKTQLQQPATPLAQPLPVLSVSLQKQPTPQRVFMAQAAPAALPAKTRSGIIPKLAEKPSASQQEKTVPTPMPYVAEALPSSVILSPPPVALAPAPSPATQEKDFESDAVVAAILDRNQDKILQSASAQASKPTRFVFVPDLVPSLSPLSSSLPVVAENTKTRTLEEVSSKPKKAATEDAKKQPTPAVTRATTGKKETKEAPIVRTAQSRTPANATPKPLSTPAPKKDAPAPMVASTEKKLPASSAQPKKAAPTVPPAATLNPKELDQRMKGAKDSDLAAQLGLSVRTVFVDIGHGGRDPGTAHNGLVERDVVLDIGKRVGKLLVSHGFKVVYSRTTDVTVPLSSRPVRANEVGADLFVSIHVNAFSNASISGFETYYLDFSRNSAASRVATLENSVSDKSLGDLQDVLAKMLLNVRTKESTGLAKAIQRTTIAQLRKQGFSTKNGGTRSAPFHVLIGTSMPAVLVEVGYCTNKKEAKWLKRSDYRTALAQGIVQGILAYKELLQKKGAAHFALT